MDNLITVKSKIEKDETQEVKLVKIAIKGNSEAFLEIMKIHKIYLYKIAYAYVKNEETALEILQECTYKALISIAKLKQPLYFKTWVTRILINIALETLKKDNKLVYLEDNTVLTTSDDILCIEEKLDLYNAIDLLRENYKTVIILRFFNDMSLESIANVMDIPQNTVKTYLRRAKESLSKILKEDYLNE